MALVQTDEEHPGVVVEGILGPVAVVDIPVDDEHPLQPAHLERVGGRYRDGVEQTEPHPPPAQSVVSRRTHQEEGRTGSGTRAVHGLDTGSGRQQGGFVRGRRDDRVGVEVSPAPFREEPQLPHVARIVHPLDVSEGSGPGFDPLEVQVGGQQDLTTHDEPLRRLGVLPGVVVEKAGVVVDRGGRHARDLPRGCGGRPRSCCGRCC